MARCVQCNSIVDGSGLLCPTCDPEVQRKSRVEQTTTIQIQEEAERSARANTAALHQAQEEEFNKLLGYSPASVDNKQKDTKSRFSAEQRAILVTGAILMLVVVSLPFLKGKVDEAHMREEADKAVEKHQIEAQEVARQTAREQQDAVRQNINALAAQKQNVATRNTEAQQAADAQNLDQQQTASNQETQQQDLNQQQAMLAADERIRTDFSAAGNIYDKFQRAANDHSYFGGGNPAGCRSALNSATQDIVKCQPYASQRGRSEGDLYLTWIRNAMTETSKIDTGIGDLRSFSALDPRPNMGGR